MKLRCFFGPRHGKWHEAGPLTSPIDPKERLELPFERGTYQPIEAVPGYFVLLHIDYPLERIFDWLFVFDPNHPHYGGEDNHPAQLHSDGKKVILPHGGRPQADQLQHGNGSHKTAQNAESNAAAYATKKMQLKGKTRRIPDRHPGFYVSWNMECEKDINYEPPADEAAQIAAQESAVFSVRAIADIEIVRHTNELGYSIDNYKLRSDCVSGIIAKSLEDPRVTMVYQDLLSVMKQDVAKFGSMTEIGTPNERFNRRGMAGGS